MAHEQESRRPDETFHAKELTAAATHLALLGSKLEPMPAALRERIEASAHALIAERSKRSTN